MYATANLYNKYRSDTVNTAGPMDLIIMLYDGCIKQIHLAELYEEENDVEQRTRCIDKAQAILDELMRSLDMSFSISHDLMRLYDFMSDELFNAVMKRDMKKLKPVADMLGELRDAWKVAKASAGSMIVLEED